MQIMHSAIELSSLQPGCFFSFLTSIYSININSILTECPHSMEDTNVNTMKSLPSSDNVPRNIEKKFIIAAILAVVWKMVSIASLFYSQLKRLIHTERERE